MTLDSEGASRESGTKEERTEIAAASESCSTTVLRRDAREGREGRGKAAEAHIVAGGDIRATLKQGHDTLGTTLRGCEVKGTRVRLRSTR